MKFINIGFGNMVSAGRIVAITCPDSAPVKRLVQDARDDGRVIDVSCGRRTRSVIITDSDHVILFDDETKEIAKEIVRNDALDRVFIATDYFDASINRISAWITGVINVKKALLFALLEPNAKMKALQEENDITSLMVLQEEMKTAPFGAVWNEYLKAENTSVSYIEEVKKYEQEVLVKR